MDEERDILDEKHEKFKSETDDFHKSISEFETLKDCLDQFNSSMKWQLENR